MRHKSERDLGARAFHYGIRFARPRGLAIAVTVGIVYMMLSSCGEAQPSAKSQPLIWDSGQWDTTNWS